jgi:hypothetical protein
MDCLVVSSTTDDVDKRIIVQRMMWINGLSRSTTDDVDKRIVS